MHKVGTMTKLRADRLRAEASLIISQQQLDTATYPEHLLQAELRRVYELVRKLAPRGAVCIRVTIEPEDDQ
jgi:hypothetical protein